VLSNFADSLTFIVPKRTPSFILLIASAISIAASPLLHVAGNLDVGIKFDKLILGDAEMTILLIGVFIVVAFLWDAVRSYKIRKTLLQPKLIVDQLDTRPPPWKTDPAPKTTSIPNSIPHLLVDGKFEFQCEYCGHVSHRVFSKRLFLKRNESKLDQAAISRKVLRGAPLWPKGCNCAGCGEVPSAKKMMTQ
jgi:hypothetical protein